MKRGAPRAGYGVWRCIRCPGETGAVGRRVCGCAIDTAPPRTGRPALRQLVFRQRWPAAAAGRRGRCEGRAPEITGPLLF